MNKSELYNNEFIINLTIDGTSYEDVEFKIVDPNKTIRSQISSIVSLFEIPKIDNAGYPIQYLLARILEDGDEPEPDILEFYDVDGRELTLIDCNVRSEDHLYLITVPW